MSGDYKIVVNGEIINDNYDDELYHYGVPGMRWGFRKALSALSSIGRGADAARKKGRHVVGIVRGRTRRARRFASTVNTMRKRGVLGTHARSQIGKVAYNTQQKSRFLKAAPGTLRTIGNATARSAKDMASTTRKMAGATAKSAKRLGTRAASTARETTKSVGTTINNRRKKRAVKRTYKRIFGI